MDALFMKSGMRNKDAIEVLKSYDGYFYGHSSDEVAEALDLAIKALSNGEWIPLPQNATNSQTFISVFRIDAWKQMIEFSKLNEQFKEFWNAPFKAESEE